LETRIPLLDPEVAAFAWTLPVSMNLKNGAGKWLLRKSLLKFLPEDLVERPKRGFAVPIGEWLRGPLRPWAEDLLDERTLGASGLFDPAPIRAQWREHVAGTRNWHYQLWTILMLQGWLRAAKIPAFS
jgi:asparagine synthase (glutamine-hydrolysing)